jgi:DNA-binding beta-propeller fold protein YncE
MGDCNCKHGRHGGATVCVECDIPQLARNNYFTGKLLVERDFTDEQRYFMGKERRHNQRLHGWGAVCGLKVSPHPTPACADRFVLIDPGTAIDCCGREILVQHQECFDFKSKLLDHWQDQNGPGTTPTDKPMDIEICVSYKECATEEVPALFDDCASDGSSRPNRILESYGFDVLIKQNKGEPEAGGIGLKWCCTLNFADAVRVVRHEDTKRLYVLTSNATAAVLYALDADTGSIEMPPQTFNASAGLDLGVSPAGDFVYVALQPSAAGSAPQIIVCKMADLTQANSVNVGTVTDSKVRLAVVPAPDGRVISIGQATGVLVWDSTINSSAGAVGTAVAGITNPLDIAVNPAATFAYVTAAGTNNISAISLAAGFPVTTFAVATNPSRLAAASTTAGDMLAVLDTSGTPTLFFVGLAAGPGSAQALGNTTGLANPPVDVALTQGGRWALVLEQDAAGKDYVQAVDEHALETGVGPVFGTALSVGAGPASEFLSDDGKHLYLPYTGTAALPGAIAIVDIEQSNCPDLFKQAIEPCPDCDDGNCIVLATITNYVYGQPVTAAQVDNLKDRHILASTSLLTDVVRCLLDSGTGGNGKDGTNGADGQGIDKVSVTFVPCDTPGGATLTGVSPNRTLVLTIPGDCNKDLTHISGVTWKANGNTIPINALLNPGLGIAFSGKVQAADLTVDSLAVLAPVANSALTIWEEAIIHITPGDFAVLGDATSAFTASAAAQVNGVVLKMDAKTFRQIEVLQPPAQKIRVIAKGDFIRDDTSKQRAIDGDHLPPWLPSRPTGDGIEGGTFESWIAIKQG